MVARRRWFPENDPPESVVTGLIGRFWAFRSRWSPRWPVLPALAVPSTRWSHRDPGCFQVCARRFPAHTRGLLDAPQGPSEPPQCDDLLFLLFAQDIAHADGAYKASRRSQCPGLYSLAGFQVTLIGRFWVTPEGLRGDPKQWLR